MKVKDKKKKLCSYDIEIILCFLFCFGIIAAGITTTVMLMGEKKNIDTYVEKLERKNRIENNLLYTNRYVYTTYYHNSRQVVVEVNEETYVKLEVGYKIQIHYPDFKYVSCYNF